MPVKIQKAVANKVSERKLRFPLMQGKGRHLFWAAAPDADHCQQVMFIFSPFLPRSFALSAKEWMDLPQSV